jgi:tetratricopeptide (TPR) repeat protein
MVWFFVLLALAAAIVIAVVLFRHWKDIRLLDPDTIRQEQERKVRDRIVKQRFDRRFRHVIGPVQRAGHGLVDRLTRTVRQVEERLAHSAGVKPFGATETEEAAMSEEASALLAEAEKRAGDGRAADAERMFLEVLKHDSRQVRAYRGLALLYAAQGQTNQAKETFAFLERIGGCNDECWSAWAALTEREGNLTDAETFRKRAVEQAPKDPIRHGELAAFYLQHGSPAYALASARRAADLEPENPQWLELCIESAIVVPDRAEAERRLQQLRALSHDRGRIYSYQEKIAALSS